MKKLKTLINNLVFLSNNKLYKVEKQTSDLSIKATDVVLIKKNDKH